MPPVVAITGPSAGIGEALARRLARDRLAMALCARRPDRLEAVASAVNVAGGRALPVVADVSRETDVERFVTATLDAFGRLDVMVCNAGFGIYGPIEDIPADRMR